MEMRRIAIDYKLLMCKVLGHRINYEADKMLASFTDDFMMVMIDDNSVFVEGKAKLKSMIEETNVEDRYKWSLDNLIAIDGKIIALESRIVTEDN